ncbi:MAG TPA: glycosyltransferase 87 family protein [Gaiellaceae bacterium]|nr:glycosyltransferase 87 family protein [Gaiellaceae bacterium]
MVGLALIGAAVATAVIAALAVRLRSLVSTVLVVYLSYVANLGLVTLVLSPFHEVTRTGLAVAEALLLATAVAAWLARGRPGPPLVGVRGALGDALSDPVTVLFLVAVAVLLGYEAVLGSTPPNNMDSLTYHLARAAAWTQHGGIYWIANAPEVELNAYQPFAELQNFFLMVATGGGRLYAVPQYLAELAILVSIYGSARRLGYAVRPATCAAALTATFSVLALEASTAQNDLFAASFPAVAACLLLGAAPVEAALAGAAVAFGIGTKLTTVLVTPILAWLAIARSRRTFVLAATGGAVGLLAIGMWGYVLNAVHTGHLLGIGTGGVQDRANPGYPRSVANAFYLVYGLMDISVLSYHVIDWLALLGVALAAGGFVWLARRGRRREAAAEASGLALPFVAPLLVVGGAALVAWAAREWGFPIRGPGGVLGPLDTDLGETYTRIANEDYSAFGPVGIVALLAAAVLAAAAYVRGRADMRHLALATALPVFLILVAAGSVWVPFLIRYFLLPAVLTAPLMALLLRRRAVAAAWLCVAAFAIGFTFAKDQPKPFTSPYGYGHPWNVSAENALAENSDGAWADALRAYRADVPGAACVGVAVFVNEPTYLLFGPDFGHHLVFLDPNGGAPLATARADVLSYVVVSNSLPQAIVQQFTDAGWTTRPLGTKWSLLSVPNPGPGTCLA